MSDKPAIQWSILNVPMERRIQTFCCLIAMLSGFGVVCASLFLLFVAPWIWVPWFLYSSFLDKDASRDPTRMNHWARSLPHFKHFRKYFPATLKKTADLDPNKSYIFGGHPHGIISTSFQANFANDYSEFRQLFPGVDLRFCTLTNNFLFPIQRQYHLSMGFVDASRETIVSLLTKGHSVLLILGGAQESLNARPGNTELVLDSRKGFVKLALQTGSSIVPTYSFGENELYDQLDNPKGSVIRKIQDLMKNNLGWTLPFFNGRGVWNYNFGFMPRRTPLLTVIGAPIDLPKVENPGDDLVNEYHEKYKEGLKKLFNDFKGEANMSDKELTFV